MLLKYSKNIPRYCLKTIPRQIFIRLCLNDWAPVCWVTQSDLTRQSDAKPEGFLFEVQGVADLAAVFVYNRKNASAIAGLFIPVARSNIDRKRLSVVSLEPTVLT